MKKKIFCALLVLTIVLSGCGKEEAVPKKETKNTVSEDTAKADEQEKAAPAETQPEAQEIKELEIVETGWHTDETNDFLYYAIVVRNPNTAYAVEFPSCTITAKDADGKIIFTREDVVGYLAPGETYANSSLEDCKGIAPANVEFTITNSESDYIASDENDPNSTKSLTISNTAEVPGDFGASYTGEITNEGATDFPGIAVTVILKNNGQVVGGETTFLDELKAGSTLPFEISAYSEVEHTECEFYVRSN